MSHDETWINSASLDNQTPTQTFGLSNQPESTPDNEAMFYRSHDIHVIASTFIPVLQESGGGDRRPILVSTLWTTFITIRDEAIHHGTSLVLACRTRVDFDHNCECTMRV